MKPVRVGIVAGEASGDQLGSGLMRALTSRRPAAFIGAGGVAMREAGLDCRVPAESLAVMGLSEVLQHLPRLLGARRKLKQQLLEERPDVFVGIDSPDFNLGLETRLRAAGIPTVHYVSPTVWAWRPGRVRKIRKAADLVLCLLPFEPQFYEAHGVRAEFVGHPMADVLSPDADRADARKELGYSDDDDVVALLPGSRRAEVARLGPILARTADWIARRRPAARFIAPMSGQDVRRRFAVDVEASATPVRIVDGKAHAVLAAADVAVIASGTATMEAMLLGCPMVVCYQVSRATAALARRLMIVDRFAMPNLLAGRDFVPEFVQDAVTPDALGQATLDWLNAPERVAGFRAVCREQHARLRRGASARAADAILALA